MAGLDFSSPAHRLLRAAVVLACGASVVAGFALPGAAQDADSVHIVPLRKRPEPAPPAARADNEEASLHLKPFRVDVDLKLVPVTVTDAKNHPVLDLKKEDFQLFEAGRQQHIQYFSSEDVPISVGVILDLSKSMRDKIDVAREALAEFFRTANPEDDYFVVTFDDRPQLLADATRSIGSIQAKLASVTPKGHTALLDAIYMAIHHTRLARYKRRALLIISDGGDNRSRYKPQELKRVVQEADVEIYAIGLYGSVFRTPEEWAGKRLLTDITEATGGHTVHLGNPRELPRVAAAISAELRSQYVLGYRPGKAGQGTGWRRIKVQVAVPHPSAAPLQVYFKRGYQGPVAE